MEKLLPLEFRLALLEEGHAALHRVLGRAGDTLAFGLGVLPLALAKGAGSGAQNAIGTGVLGGMIVGTLLGLLFVPLFFVLVERLFVKRRPPVSPPLPSLPASTDPSSPPGPVAGAHS